MWGRIVSELAELQDAAPSEKSGSVVNPICGEPYVVDTCCAAAVFAAEHQRTDDERWRARADDALTAAGAWAPFSGIGEPTWDVSGWHDVPESLPATGIAVDAYVAALNRLGRRLDDDRIDDVFDLLLKCRTKDGGFVHNAPTEEAAAAEIQNATASALNLMGRLGRGSSDVGRPVDGGLDAALSRLQRGQVSSGFWPYFYPGSRLRKVIDLPLRVVLKHGKFSLYLGHGDVTHHLMTLYFATGYFSASGAVRGRTMLAAGWRWMRDRLVEDADGGLSIDWAEDPSPGFPQCTNARDTNAYFLIVGAMPGLVSLGIVDRAESAAIVNALLAHVSATLTAPPGRAPCISPYEGPPEIVKNILPMFEQSVAWKGHLLADTVLAEGT